MIGALGVSPTVAAVFAVALLLLGVRATAAPEDSNGTAKAKALYDNGVTDYNLGHYEEAFVSFEQGYRIRHDAAFLFNIAQCQRQLRRYEDAERSYRAYLRESTDLPQETRDQVQKLIAGMQKAVNEQRAKLPPPGVQPSTQVKQQSAIQQPSTPPMIASVTTLDERAGRTNIMAGIGVAAFGVAAIAAGGGFYAVASSANDQLNHPTNGIYSESAENGRDTFQALDIAAFVIGGVAVATGATVAVLGWRQRHRMTLTPAASAGRVGAGFNLDF